MTTPIQQELDLRQDMWDRLRAAGGPRLIAPGLLNELGFYRGGRGIWVDKKRTNSLTDDGEGITVGVLHTGSSYADDVSEDGVIYHYPNNELTATRDQSEVEATKNAGRFNVPVFVITYPSPSSSKRSVDRAWVEGWDDKAKLFLLSFGDEQPPLINNEVDEDHSEFHLTDSGQPPRIHATNARPGQHRFQFLVFRRYGSRCAVCEMDVPDMLDAAHIRPKKNRGSDDPRNGLVLCANHHRAFDAGHFAFEPETLTLQFKQGGLDASALNIAYMDLSHLRLTPHPQALEWYWQKWIGNSG